MQMSAPICGGSDGKAGAEGSLDTDGPAHTRYSDTIDPPSYANPMGGLGVGPGVPSYADREIPVQLSTASQWWWWWWWWQRRQWWNANTWVGFHWEQSALGLKTFTSQVLEH